MKYDACVRGQERFAQLTGATASSQCRIMELEKNTNELREALKGSQEQVRALQTTQSEGTETLCDICALEADPHVHLTLHASRAFENGQTIR